MWHAEMRGICAQYSFYKTSNEPVKPYCINLAELRNLTNLSGVKWAQVGRVGKAGKTKE